MASKPNQNVQLAPLSALPVLEKRVCPLPKTKKWNKYLLTIMDFMIHFPEAVPLRNIKAKSIIEALTHLFSWYDLPKEVQHDRVPISCWEFSKTLCVS